MSTPLKDADLVCSAYGFQDRYRYSYTESYRLRSPYSGFYAIRKGLGGQWHSWHFEAPIDMERISETAGRRYFGFADTYELAYDRVIEDLLIKKLQEDDE